MTNNHKYQHIKSFKDFEDEKIKLHYLIRLSEKKLEIKKYELAEYINPIRFLSSIFYDIARPAMELIRSVVMHFMDRHKRKQEN